MSRAKKVGVVLAGYALALVAGAVSSHLYNRRVSALPYDTSGGMYAAGDMLAWLGFFLPIAGATTLLALWFLREQRWLWKVAAIAAVAFASIGLLAVLAPLTHRGHAAPAPLMLLELVGVVQMLGVPDDLQVDLWVPGCPPHPFTLLDGLLRLLGRIEDGSRKAPTKR